VANLVPQNIPRTLTRAVVLAGYQLPRGTVVVPQISAVLLDESVGSRRLKN
jgi:cytochrome P450